MTAAAAIQQDAFLTAILGDRTGCAEIRVLEANVDPKTGRVVQHDTFRSTVSFWGDNVVSLATEADRLDGISGYITVNRVRRDLMARVDRLKKCKSVTVDTDILCLRHLFLDFDSVRPKGISATAAELCAAQERLHKLLTEYPEIERSALWGCSGNGCWLIVRLPDYPNDDEHRTLVGRVTDWLSSKYTDKLVELDPTMKNPARVMPLVGTLKCKGVSTTDRPHRMVTLDTPIDKVCPAFDLVQFAAENIPDHGKAQAKPTAKQSRVDPHKTAKSKKKTESKSDAGERARAYLFSPKFPDSIEGEGGHKVLYRVACELVDGFGLNREQAWPIYQEWNQAKAKPPEDEKQLGHKLDDAIKKNPTPSLGRLDAAEETHAEILLRLAESATLFHDDSGRAFASVPVENHLETQDLLGTGFRRWLKRRFYMEQGRPPSVQSFQDVMGILEAKAQIDGHKEQVFIRVAEHDSRIYLDLGDPAWRAIEIDAKGWRIVDKPPVRFRRPNGFHPLPEPTHGGSITTLKDFVNIHDDDFLLLVAFLAAAMRVSGPYPILVLTGEQGAAKSTLARTIRLLLDPHAMPLRSEPREPLSLVIGAVNGWLVAMDNLSTMPGWLSDALCRLSTGGGQANRTLYTNDEETFLDAQRPVVLTGITDFVNRADLTDRCVFLHLLVINETNRQTEKKFFKAFHAEYPAILGALLDAIAGGLKKLESVDLKSIPRMADFAVFGEAVCRGLGYDAGKFLEACRGNRKAANESILEDSYVATAIRELVATKEWTGTTAALKDALELIVSDKIAKSDRWPKSPRGMSGVLRRLAPSLRAIGISVEFPDRKKKDRIITISPTVESGSNQQAPQAPQAPGDEDDVCDTTCGGACSVPVGAGRIPTGTKQAPQQAPSQNGSQNGVAARGADGADGAGRIPHLSTPGKSWFED